MGVRGVEPDFVFIDGSDVRLLFTVGKVAANSRMEWRLVCWREIMKRFKPKFSMTALAVACAFFVGCSEDSPVEVSKDTNAYRSPTTAENTLFNFVKAYNEMNVDRYESVLDEKFSFLFSVTSVEYPNKWNIEDELNATRHMFGGADSGDSRYGKVIDVDVRLVFDEDSWRDISVAGGEGEEERRATVHYIYEVTVEPDITFINGSDMKAEFTLRKHKDGAWKIVRWDDLGFGCKGQQVRTPGYESCEWNWGQVKALYLFED